MCYNNIIIYAQFKNEPVQNTQKFEQWILCPQFFFGTTTLGAPLPPFPPASSLR